MCLKVVEWQSLHPWYQVAVKEVDNGKEVSRMFLLGDVSILDDVLEKQCDDFKVSEVYLVSPPWMNGSGDWAMNKVMSLIVGRGEAGGKVSMHKIADGVVYTSPAGGKIDTFEEEDFKVLI
ncbi:hypothetical protein PshuTeo1_14780 [Pseudomonas hunanensis]|nr:hypothetical protein PshuTeo1_14780 [Pseudomonas hunanensis]